MKQKLIIFLILFLISIIFFVFFYFLNKGERDLINNTIPTINVPGFTPTIETAPINPR